ncbi:hypothetical protein [Stenotrophomonas sp. MMGLT7]|uniref:hypothetical protein n=1 Tax=Stenotrophomonas sp. MMGLT7 TaxID=2901227 RepID=UPI001E3273A1|nr:hypothetical protein [Stenotrophomonas sp. MMGLT7]MCD7096959.1 hypothetical protein [Stenotrophomonas sp. MMGLT7]
MAETLQITVHASQVARAFGIVGEGMLESVRELEKAHRIIRLALNAMDDATKARWFDGITAAGLEGEGRTRANERERLLAQLLEPVPTPKQAAVALDAARLRSALLQGVLERTEDIAVRAGQGTANASDAGFLETQLSPAPWMTFQGRDLLRLIASRIRATGGNRADAMFLGEFARMVITQLEAAKAAAVRAQEADHAR